MIHSATQEKSGESIASRLPPEVAAPMFQTWTEAQAFEFCTALTKSHYENFPVGSFLVPKHLQPAVHSLYAFMRTSDDFSDENRRPGDDQERLTWLNAWDELLAECEQGRAQHPVFIALRNTLQTYQLPAQWLRDLLTAFKMDCTIRRYQTYADLLNYCRYSANPVGRLILTLFGYRSEELYGLSDSICTGLQLANHWQDVAVDLEKDRIYLPLEDLNRFGVEENHLLPSREKAGMRDGMPSGMDYPSPQSSPLKGEEVNAFRQLMKFEVDRTRGVFNQGKTLPERVQGRLRLELRMTWKGGVCILDKIEKVNYDVFQHRPVVSKADWLLLGLQSLIHV